MFANHHHVFGIGNWDHDVLGATWPRVYIPSNRLMGWMRDEGEFAWLKVLHYGAERVCAVRALAPLMTQRVDELDA